MKIPVHLGDLSGPDGNVFVVIGRCSRSIQQCEEAGLEIPDEARYIVANYKNHTYEEILDLIDEAYDDLDRSIIHLHDMRWDNNDEDED